MTVLRDMELSSLPKAYMSGLCAKESALSRSVAKNLCSLRVLV